MNLFYRYIKQRWRGIAALAAFALIFLIFFCLYHLPAKAVLYPTMLCAILGMVMMFLDFGRIRKKHELLSNIRDFTDILTGIFPRADGMEDEDYQEIIHLISEDYKAYQDEAGRKYLDMVDYYTVWVHQIKTPIASMKLHLQNEDSSLSRKLMVELHRVEQYVEMVLTFLRLNSESTDYVIKEYDLDKIIKQAVRKFAGEFIGRKISLNYEPKSVMVITDEKWLSFVIGQVLSNALKYTSQGSITISIEPEKKLKIRDTGIGIALEDLPRIFENGYTGYNGRTDKKASGIGLYLCKRICSNLGHEISVKSIMGMGTIVTIDLAQRALEVE